MRELIDTLNYHTKLYNQGKPEINDVEWDRMYFKLQEWEKLTGITYPDSPTQSLKSFEVIDSLRKVSHNHPMLSLKKTKDISELLDFINDKNYVIMAKMDGLTCSLRYMNGKLVSAETRGDGEVGEDILHNAKVVKNIPQTIGYKGELIVDGEIICDNETFNKFKNEYSNARNFAAGSIRLLDSGECAKRELKFVAWDVIKGFEEHTELSQHLVYLKSYGFTVVPFIIEHDSFTRSMLEENMEIIKSVALNKNYPIDGLVVKYDNIEYGKSLGRTDHHFNNGLAFKFIDDLYPTYLVDIEWTMGRTGILTPVAIVEPVEIEGAIIERASLHNVSVLKKTLHGNGWFGQKVWVSRMNQIIPQIVKAELEAEDHFEDVKYFEIPTGCPCCGYKTSFRTLNFSTNLVCDNPQCSGQLINRLDHFCGKKGLDIKGLSKMTLEKLIDWGWVSNIEDIFKLFEHKDEWIKKPGFGDKSVKNILTAINESRNCSLNKFIAALGIPLIGNVAAKQLAEKFLTWENFIEAVHDKYEFYLLPNMGVEMDSAIIHFDYSEALKLTHYLVIQNYQIEKQVINTLEGKTFVITGKLKKFKNRAELKAYIESYGGRVTDSVTSKTNYLINNDITSTSSKNKKAQDLNIPIITEDTLIILAKGEQK